MESGVLPAAVGRSLWRQSRSRERGPCIAESNVEPGNLLACRRPPTKGAQSDGHRPPDRGLRVLQTIRQGARNALIAATAKNACGSLPNFRRGVAQGGDQGL